MNSTNLALDFSYIMTKPNVRKGRHDLVETNDEPDIRSRGHGHQMATNGRSTVIRARDNEINSRRPYCESQIYRRLDIAQVFHELFGPVRFERPSKIS